jgi:hypothetical protein
MIYQSQKKNCIQKQLNSHDGFTTTTSLVALALSYGNKRLKDREM